jgi:hypothetical protein
MPDTPEDLEPWHISEQEWVYIPVTLVEEKNAEKD